VPPAIFNFYYTVSDLICAKKKNGLSRALILNLFYLLQIHLLQIHDLQIHLLQIHSMFYKSSPLHVLQYALKTWLMTGFKDNGHLTAQQKRFTNRLSSKQMVIERGIGLLKGGFGKLKVMADIDRTRLLPKLVIAACTLHNFCIYSNDEIYDFLQPLDNDDD